MAAGPWRSAAIRARMFAGKPEADMSVHLHHVNILAKDLDATIAFYVEAIGLSKGDRPPFGFPGAWLYDGARPAIHLNHVAEAPAAATAAVDHVAFAYDALDEALARLDRLNLTYSRPRLVPGTAIRQCFTKDPNGVTVELQGP
jgi:catechol 2,3-dioxygenase-like lactoylglutathione lyase family enzyme